VSAVQILSSFILAFWGETLFVGMIAILAAIQLLIAHTV
jgi:hypothetical protein